MIDCVCVEKHVPLPLSTHALKVAGSIVALCPTTYENVMELLTAYRKYGTVPPGRVTKHYSRYVREICLSLWQEHESNMV